MKLSFLAVVWLTASVLGIPDADGNMAGPEASVLGWVFSIRSYLKGHGGYRDES